MTAPVHRDDLIADRLSRAIRACERVAKMADSNATHADANGAFGVACNDRAIVRHARQAANELSDALRRCGA